MSSYDGFRLINASSLSLVQPRHIHWILLNVAAAAAVESGRVDYSAGDVRGCSAAAVVASAGVLDLPFRSLLPLLLLPRFLFLLIVGCQYY